MQEVAFLEVPRNYRHDVVAVSDLPRLVHAQAPVTVPVQGEAHVGLHAGRKLGEAPRMGRAALEVDVIAVRLRAYRLDLCTEAFECEGADPVRRAVRAVKRYPVAVQVKVDAAEKVVYVTPLGARDPGCLPDRTAFLGYFDAFELGLDRLLGIIRKLEPPGAEELDAVVLVGIVGCLLYTSDAADDLLCVDLGGRRIIKKK